MYHYTKTIVCRYYNVLESTCIIILACNITGSFMGRAIGEHKQQMSLQRCVNNFHLGENKKISYVDETQAGDVTVEVCKLFSFLIYL